MMLNYQNIPTHYQLSGLKRYVEDRVAPGVFLMAVLQNDLKGAVQAADDNNIRRLPEWVSFCYNELPADIWGSPAKVQRHLSGEH